MELLSQVHKLHIFECLVRSQGTWSFGYEPCVFFYSVLGGISWKCKIKKEEKELRYSF